MSRLQPLLAAALPALLSACQLPPPALAAPACPILESGQWAAWVSAMPGPGAGPKLIVAGRVTVPTGGYRIRLAPGPVLEIHPPIQQLLLEAQPPAGAATQAVVTQNVRGEFPALEAYGEVVVKCGDQVLASIRNVERAY